MNFLYDGSLVLSWSSFSLVFVYKLWEELQKYKCLFPKRKVSTVGYSQWHLTLCYSEILAATVSVMEMNSSGWEGVERHGESWKFAQNVFMFIKNHLWMSPIEANLSLLFCGDVTFPSSRWDVHVTPIDILIWEKWSNVHYTEQIIKWREFLFLCQIKYGLNTCLSWKKVFIGKWLWSGNC